MAEAALFGIAKSVLQQLASPALDEFRLLWGHKKEFEKLENTVTTIRNVLQDADRRQSSDATVQGWLVRLRLVLYDADDFFDAISAKLLLQKAEKGTQIGKKVRRFASKPYRLAFLVKNAHKVKKLRQRFDDIARDINGFNFLPNQPDLDATLSRIGREQTHSYVRIDGVIGREQEAEDIVSLLLPHSSNSKEQGGVSVIAVIGIGGLGKTTLAKLVYNDDRVEKTFNLRMWACINYFLDLKQVLITLLKSATMRVPEDLDLDQLQILFRKEIEGKRFLLVLDDVWDEDLKKWRNLKDLLSSGKEGSKVLTTTRSKVVAQRSCAIEPYFYLRGLSDESAWLLFKKIALEDEEERDNSGLEHLRQLIKRKCANVPLAIVTLASLLREKDKERWLHVNAELSKLTLDDYNDNIMQVLKFSYKELPYPVKRCFAYCSIFPKDYLFHKNSLIHLWIAQGFVEPLMNQSLGDRGEEYLFCLVDRCFFNLFTLDGSIYQMHDLIRDLAIEVSASENILVDHTPQGYWDKTVRHVSITCELESVVDHVCSFPHSKSLRTFLSCQPFWRPNIVEKLMPSFKSLRVLVFWKIEEVPSSIGELILLRYLDLSYNDMERLPRSIFSLFHLRYLILRRCKRLKELPEDLGELNQLRHLDLSNSHMERLPSSICGLRHLESLILEGCGDLEELPEDLGDLLRLRHLVLEGCNNLVIPMLTLTSLLILDRLVLEIPSGALNYLVKVPHSFESLTIVLPLIESKNSNMDAERSFRESRLRALAVICEIGLDTEVIASSDYIPLCCELMMSPVDLFLEPATANTEVNALQLPPNVGYLWIVYFGGNEIPHWVSCLKQLLILKLNGCERCVKLPPLSDLPSLKELEICDMPSMVTIEDIKFYKPNSFFPSLQNLSIENMLNLTSWWLQPPTVLPTFPRLTKVSIYNCPNLTRCLPLFPLVENLWLAEVREEIIWQIIGSEVIYSKTDGNSVLKKLEMLRIEDGKINLDGQEANLSTRIRCLVFPTMNRNLFKGLKGMASLEELTIGHHFNEELQEEEEGEEGLPWKHLRKLERVELVFGEGFSMRNNQHLLNGFQFLTSLKDLSLWKCKELYLPWRAIISLPNLQCVRIEEVEEVIDVDSDVMMIQTQLLCRSSMALTIVGGSGEWIHDIPWKSLPFVEFLWLESLSNMKSLPEGIQHLLALTSLTIHDIPSVVSFPDWMSSLSSLTDLYMSGISSELKKRCEKAIGEDWPKILHIPLIRIRRDDLSSESEQGSP